MLSSEIESTKLFTIRENNLRSFITISIEEAIIKNQNPFMIIYRDSSDEVSWPWMCSLCLLLRSVSIVWSYMIIDLVM